MNSAWVIGAGLAGCEAAWALANAGLAVTLYEMKPRQYSPAHQSPDFAELVCSNSFKATRRISAAGMLKEEMRMLGSLCLSCADETAVSAGGALAVDRTAFSRLVTEKIHSHPGIAVIIGEVREIPPGPGIIASGPLTSDRLAEAISALLGVGYLSFHDASAPIVAKDSIDMERVFFATRYDRGEADYINCPFSKEEYDIFYEALVSAQAVELKRFEKEFFKVYEGCMPVEVMARRGKDTLRFGPMRPVGIRDPKTGHRPWANIQLRKEDAAGSLYNMVGFQTNLTFGEQKRVFSLIPGLEQAVFHRFGVMHRNTFINSPRLLDGLFCLKNEDRLFFAGQITGVEGYMESAASGMVAGRALVGRLLGRRVEALPRETVMGALCAYVSDPAVEDFQPMGANMGILPPLPPPLPKGKEARYIALADRAEAAMRQFINFP